MSLVERFHCSSSVAVVVATLATLLLCRVGEGYWAFDGVTMTSMEDTEDGMMMVNCSATHLTSFAVLVDVSGSLSVSHMHMW